MYKHVLIPTDGSATATKAVEAGIDYAREAAARITFFTAVPEYQPPGEADIMARRVISFEEHERRSKAAADAVLGPAAERARWAGIEFATDYAQKDRPWEAIVEAAQRLRCDAIFMGSHGRRGISRLVHGSQAIDVLAHSQIPTLVIR